MLKRLGYEIVPVEGYRYRLVHFEPLLPLPLTREDVETLAAVRKALTATLYAESIEHLVSSLRPFIQANLQPLIKVAALTSTPNAASTSAAMSWVVIRSSATPRTAPLHLNKGPSYPSKNWSCTLPSGNPAMRCAAAWSLRTAQGRCVGPALPHLRGSSFCLSGRDSL